jgi:hypothetical protein
MALQMNVSSSHKFVFIIIIIIIIIIIVKFLCDWSMAMGFCEILQYRAVWISETAWVTARGKWEYKGGIF